LQKVIFSIQQGNGKCAKYAHDISSMDKFILQEETNKYVLSKEELVKVISEGFDKLKSYVSFNDLEDIKEEYINLIL